LIIKRILVYHYLWVKMYAINTIGYSESMKPHKALQYFRGYRRDHPVSMGKTREILPHFTRRGEFHISGRQDGDASKQEYLCGDLIPVCRML